MKRAVGLSPICLPALLFSVFDASCAKERSALTSPMAFAPKEGDSLPANDLLQFRSKGHILGFKEDRVYMVGMGYALIEEFVGARKTMPVGSGSSEGSKGAAQLQEVLYKDLWEGITLK